VTTGLWIAIASPLLAASAQAGSPWLADEGQLNGSVVVVYERFSEFYRGEERVDLPFGQYDEVTALTSFEYGLREFLTLDLTIGYVRGFPISGPMGTSDVNDGLYDVHLGMRFAIWDELETDRAWAPTVSFRFGGIIEGTYEANGALYPAIPGDKASGIEGELSFGKMLPHDFGVTSDFGIRVRNKNIPIEWHFRFATFKTFFDVLTISAAYDQWAATSGIDVGGPGWDPSRFREVKEISRNIELSAGASDPWGTYWAFYYARTVDGRNTGLKDIFGFSLSATF
jgi:hypothetical protein